jgi:hypothetical protein
MGIVLYGAGPKGHSPSSVTLQGDSSVKRFYYAVPGKKSSWVKARSKADATRMICAFFEVRSLPNGTKIWTK